MGSRSVDPEVTGTARSRGSGAEVLSYGIQDSGDGTESWEEAAEGDGAEGGVDCGEGTDPV